MEIDIRKKAACALNRIFGFEPRLGLSLIEYAGSPEAVFGMDREMVRQAMGPYWKYISQICPSSLDSAGKELDRVYDSGGSFIGMGEEGYPTLLSECEDPPIGLYVRSVDDPADIFGRRPAIAIVGTRDMSPYGEGWCRDFIECLSSLPEKPLIISGLAYGVDITAHRAALDKGLPTIAVMATGIDSVYPRNHIHTADRMAQTPGCALVTDYPVGTSPLAIHFMRRNRIIAGLSESVILVESRIRGGGMITARLGNSYNRSVYALPGRIDDIRSQGCNLLIREKIAEATGSVEELVAAMGLGRPGRRQGKDPGSLIALAFPEASPGLREELTAVATTVKGHRGIDIGGIKDETGMSHGDVAGLLEMLCAGGIISMDLLGQCRFM